MHDPEGKVVIDIKGKPCNPFVIHQSWLFECGDRCSYGINSRVGGFLQDSNKILMVEYFKPVACVVGADAPDLVKFTEQMQSPDWAGWGYGRARHRRVMNVLFADGRVEGKAPHLIDPSLAKEHDLYWKPVHDPPLAE